MTDLPTLLRAAFRGREDTYAREAGLGFRPVQAAMTVADVTQHIAQKRCCGVYVCRADSTVWFTVCDWDGKHETDWQDRAMRVAAWLTAHGITPLVELSQSGKGMHVWLFFEKPEAAADVRRWWDEMLAACGVVCREVFPKQDKLEAGGLGNLIRLPLWRRSCFVDSSGAVVPPEMAMTTVRRYRLADLWRHVPPPPAAGTDAEARKQGVSARVASLLARDAKLRQRWEGNSEGLADRSRSGVAMSLAYQLVRAYVPTPEVVEAIHIWGERQNVTDKTDREKWVRRTVRRAYELVAPAEEVVSCAGSTLRDCAMEYLGDVATRPYCPSGIPALDSSFEGVALGELALVASRPSHGKTAFAIQWAHEQAARGMPVLLVSEEMSRYALGSRCVTRIVDREAVGSDRARQAVEANYAPLSPIHVVVSACTIERVTEIVDSAAVELGIRAVVVDYIQLLSARGGRERHEEIGYIARQLRALTTRHHLATLAAAQINREPVKRQNNVPLLADLADSGKLEQAADVVLALRWPWKDDPTYRPKEEFHLRLLKRRNGPIREPLVTAAFDDARQRFC